MFKNSLINNDIETLRKVPKTDLHNHFYLGGNREYIKKMSGKFVNPLKSTLSSMDEMHKWVDDNLSDIFAGIEGRQLALEASFIQAKIDGVKVLEFGEDIWGNSKYYNSDVSNIIRMFNDTRDRVAPDIDLKLQIGISRHCNIDDIQEWIEPFWDYKEFHSIDLYGDELAQPIKNFRSIYRRAKKNGLILKAHVGEWGDADSVMRTVEVLELDEVQHGISASDSSQIMQWLSDNGIQLNVCPTSNLLLGRVDSISSHPIRTLYDNGVKVTINSDDVLMFDSPVSEEYMKLYNSKVFNADELNIIRLNGFR